MNESVSKKKFVQPKKKRKIGFLDKLRLLEINGSVRERLQSSKQRVFDHIPSRRVFRLSDMIEGDDWKFELVFLGFTQDSQYILSYSCKFSGRTTLLPANRYYFLQWWLFVPYRSLKKVREIRLFGDQELSEDVYIGVYQWPDENTKLMIFGYSSMGQDTDSCKPCFVTVAAIPPLKPCPDCIALRVEDSENENNEEEDEELMAFNRKLCLTHALTVHTRYFVVSPFPSFNPIISMKLNNLLIFNTGDNIIALCINLETSNKDSIVETRRETLETLPETSRLDLLSPLEEETTEFVDVLESFAPSLSETDSSDNLGLFHYLQEPYGENRITSKWMGRPKEDILPSLKRNKTLNEETYTDVKIKDETVSEEVGELNGDSKCLTLQLDNTFKKDNFSMTDLSLGDHPKYSPQSPPQLLPHSYRLREKENISPKPVRVISLSPKMLLSPRERRHPNEEGREIRNNEMPLSVPLDSGSSELQSEDLPSNGEEIHRRGTCVTENVQYFGEMEGFLGSPSQFDDESAETEYHSMLSFEVLGSQSNSLKMLNPEKLMEWGGTVVSVRQLTFDIEQFAHGTAQKICSSAGKKYLAFLDYDLQIIDVCEVSHNVIALVLMQVQAMVGQKGVAKELRSSERNVFQTGFKFTWNVKTGIYNVIDTEELTEVRPNSGNYNLKAPFWSSARLKADSLRKDWCTFLSKKIPRALSAANVEYDESLQVIWSPLNDLAIIH